MNRTEKAVNDSPEQTLGTPNSPQVADVRSKPSRRRSGGTVTRDSVTACAAGDDVFSRLTAPFPAESISFKPQTVQGSRALAVAYLDVRSIMDRLDEVLGPAGWQDDYEPMQDGGVKCTLRLKINGEWIGKSDVGSRSDQPDEGDRQKAAFSDALKRTSVKWGIGRYLYRLPKQWLGYDPQKRQFTETARLPAWALPSGERPEAALAARGEELPEPAERGAEERPAVAQGSQASSEASTPVSGRELFRWLKDRERVLVDAHACRPGELVEHVARAGAAAGHGTQIVRWDTAGIGLGVAEALRFVASRRDEPPAVVERDLFERN